MKMSEEWEIGDMEESSSDKVAMTENDSFPSQLTTAQSSNNLFSPCSQFSESSLSYSKDEYEDDFQISRKKTTIEKESLRRKDVAKEFISHLPPEISVKEYLPTGLSGAIFCGHLVADLDSIAGSIGAAELYGGIPARASDINPETAFALKYWNVEVPCPIEDLLKQHPKAGVCLVDHQQTSQLNKAIDVSRIVGVIDHHALQNSTIITELPIYIDIRPWGSMSSIITHTFMTLRKRPRHSTAGLMLCAILSDTLNLQSPTTTEWDRLMVAVLVQLTGVEDVQFLASQQFKAKSSELAGLPCHDLITGDQKVFTFKTHSFDGSIAFAVVETTDDEVILKRADELVEALHTDKEEKGYSVSFLAVVNIIDLKSKLIACSPNERSLAHEAFPDCEMILEAYKDPYVMDLSNLVSRKRDFVPAISGAIKRGWSNAPSGSIHISPSDVFDFARYRDSALPLSRT